MRRSSFLIFLLISFCIFASASDFYYSQTAQGSNNGTNCANSFAYNDVTNGMTQKSGAGVVEHICGTWTFGTGVTVASFSTGGASGNPFTIKWETGAVVQASYFSSSGGFIFNSLSNIVLDGGTNGLIRNTLNGTGSFSLTSLTVAGGTTTATCVSNCQPYLNPVNSGDSPTLVNITGTGNASCNVQVTVLTAPSATTFTFATPSGCTSTSGGSFGFQCPGGTCTNQQSSVAIHATGVSNFEIKNLTCNNIYWHRSIYDAGTAGTYDTNCVVFDGSNNKIHNNTMADGGNVIIYDFGGNTNTANWIYNNDFSHGGWILRCSGAGGSSTDFEFHDNHMHDIGAFDQSNSNVHGNGIHCYDGSGGGFVSMLIYNNLADGDVGTHVTSWYYLEGNSCAAGNDEFGSSGGGSPGTLYFFNNISVENSTTYSHPMNGTVLPSCGTGHLIFNNYIMAFSNTGTGGNADTGYSASPSWSSTPTGTSFENNIVQEGCFFRIATINAAVVDHNYYAHGTCGNNFWQLPSSSTSTFTTWQTAGWDTHGAYNSGADWPNLNNCATYACGSGVPSTGFSGAGQGANLSGFCTTISGISSTAGTSCLSDTTAGGTRTAAVRPTGGAAWDVGAYQLVLPQVATPTFNPAAGYYSSAGLNIAINISSPTSAVSCVTTDGSLPVTNGSGGCTNGTQVARGGTVSFNTPEQIQAIGTASGFTDSSVASGAFDIIGYTPTRGSGIIYQGNVKASGKYTYNNTDPTYFQGNPVYTSNIAQTELVHQPGNGTSVFVGGQHHANPGKPNSFFVWGYYVPTQFTASKVSFTMRNTVDTSGPSPGTAMYNYYDIGMYCVQGPCASATNPYCNKAGGCAGRLVAHTGLVPYTVYATAQPGTVTINWADNATVTFPPGMYVLGFQNASWGTTADSAHVLGEATGNPPAGGIWIISDWWGQNTQPTWADYNQVFTDPPRIKIAASGGDSTSVAIQVASNVLTVTLNNGSFTNFAVGDQVQFEGLANATFLNDQIPVTILTASSTSFTAAIQASNYGPTNETTQGAITNVTESKSGLPNFINMKFQNPCVSNPGNANNFTCFGPGASGGQGSFNMTPPHPPNILFSN